MKLLRQLGPLLALVIMIVLLSFSSPYFFTVDNLLNIFRQSSVNALLALGQLLVIITAGIDLSVGSILGLCAVLIAIFLKAGWPIIFSMLGCFVVGALVGWLNGAMLTKLKLPHPFISTLATMNVARGLALIISGGFPISDLPANYRFWGAASISIFPVPVLIVLVVYIIFHFFLAKTVAGRDIYAIGGNKIAAYYSGIPTDKRLIMVYTLSGALAALAAIILTGRMNSGFPLAGMGAELDSIAAVIIGGASFFGGVGTVWGTLIGALLMGVLRNGLNLLNVSAYWQTVVIGAVIVWAVWMDVLRQRVMKKKGQ